MNPSAINPAPTACKRRKRFDDQINRDIHALTKLDNHHVIGALLLDFGLIAGAIGLYFVSAWFLPVTILIIGSRQRALITLFHESAHGVLARSGWWNFVSGTFLSGYLVFHAYFRYHASHVRLHHGELGDPVRDPDTRSYVEQGLFDNKLTRVGFLRMLARKTLLLNVLQYLRYLLRDRVMPSRWPMPRKERLEYPVFVAYWIGLLAIVIGLDVFEYFLLFWMLPYLTALQVIGWLIEIAEHYPLAAHSNQDIEATRNRHSGPIERFLTGAHGEQYHLTHHLRPGIPYWNIAEAHLAMMRDPDYRRVNEYSGGIFSSARKGVPTILEEIVASLPASRHARWGGRVDP